MPSPFPGMDPFLEHPDVFPDLHDSFVTYLRESLQRSLPEPYFATIGTRIWVDLAHRAIGPDVKVLHPANGTNVGVSAGGGVAVAVPTLPVIIHVPQDEIREPFINIYARQGEDRLVASLEVLSITNKTPGERGRELYLRKQRDLALGQVHLVEIDLLSDGAHSTAVPHDAMLQATGPLDYHVCVHRFDQPEDFQVYPVRLEARLPTLGVPLLPEHQPVSLDLQAILDRCYDAGPDRRNVRYREAAIVPPLSPERTAWAMQLLREKGVVP